jgi:hypothetical protein
VIITVVNIIHNSCPVFFQETMETTAASATTPLMSTTKQEVTNNIAANKNTSCENELQFYDPHAVTNIPRDVAFGYLILLTGGNVEYKAPTLPTENESSDQRPQQQLTVMSAPTLNDETSQLAYAAIVDGNVLHAVFGLKAAANGKANNIINEKPKSSIFCCLPTSSTLDALQFILPQTTKNKLKREQLVEVLQEVRDLYFESMEQQDGVASFSLHTEVIKAYANCFMAIINYHDQKLPLEKSSGNKESKGLPCCPSILENLIVFNSKRKRSKKDQKVEGMKKETLDNIAAVFDGLRDKIWEKLEHATGATAAISVTSG